MPSTSYAMRTPSLIASLIHLLRLGSDFHDTAGRAAGILTASSSFRSPEGGRG